MSKFKWVYEETGETCGESEEDVDTPHCPQCGQPCEYWEGQIGQDFMGNDIDGWNWTCYQCMVGTEVMEGTWNE